MNYVVIEIIPRLLHMYIRKLEEMLDLYTYSVPSLNILYLHFKEFTLSL